MSTTGSNITRPFHRFTLMPGKRTTRSTTKARSRVSRLRGLAHRALELRNHQITAGTCPYPPIGCIRRQSLRRNEPAPGRATAGDTAGVGPLDTS